MRGIARFCWLLVVAFCPSLAGAMTYLNKPVPFNGVDASSHTKLGPSTGGVYSSSYRFGNPGTCGTNPPVIDDAISDNVPIGFGFSYGGTSFTQVRVMSNGRLQFNDNAWCGSGSPVTQQPYPDGNLTYTMRICRVAHVAAIAVDARRAVSGADFGLQRRIEVGAVAFDAGNEFRFGVLRLMPAYGSELVALPVLAEAQYWDGLRMATNAADQCTAVPATSAAMANYQRQLSACKTAVAATVPVLASGRTWLKLARPGNGNGGSVDLAVQLGTTAAGRTCTAAGGSDSAAAAANLPWLQGKWNGAAAYDQNPTTRASFGQYRSPLIYQRESF